MYFDVDYFDATVVFVTKFSLLFRLVLAILCVMCVVWADLSECTSYLKFYLRKTYLPSKVNEGFSLSLKAFSHKLNMSSPKICLISDCTKQLPNTLSNAIFCTIILKFKPFGFLASIDMVVLVRKLFTEMRMSIDLGGIDHITPGPWLLRISVVRFFLVRIFARPKKTHEPRTGCTNEITPLTLA